MDPKQYDAAHLLTTYDDALDRGEKLRLRELATSLGLDPNPYGGPVEREEDEPPELWRK